MPAFIVIGCLVKTGESDMLLVDIPVDCGIPAFETIDDLCVEHWIRPGRPQSHIIDIDIGRLRFTEIPGKPELVEDGFTVYFMDQVLPLPTNTLLSVSEDSVLWKGDVLVVKNAGTEGVVDVESSDWPDIKHLLHMCVSSFMHGCNLFTNFRVILRGLLRC
jgi:hypothetical protein